MRTLIYKRTHCGDPDPQAAVFGNHDCMRTVRGREFYAVIGIGGIRPWPVDKAIAGKLTWVGIGAHKIFDDEIGESCPMPDTCKGGSNGSGPKLSPLRGPRVAFDYFWCPEAHGPLLEVEYPALALRMYVNKYVRAIMHSPSPVPVGEPKDTEISYLDRDVRKILERGRAESRSDQLANRDFQKYPQQMPIKLLSWAITISRARTPAENRGVLRDRQLAGIDRGSR